jgi:hypothetical protein
MFASQFEWQCRQNLNEKSVQKNQNLAISRWHQIITTFSDNNRRIIFIYLKLKLLYLFTEEEKSTKSEEWKVWRFDRHSSEKFLLNFLALSFLWWVILKILNLILLLLLNVFLNVWKARDIQQLLFVSIQSLFYWHHFSSTLNLTCSDIEINLR